MRSGHCIHDKAKRYSQVVIDNSPGNMSIQTKIDQILPFVLFPESRIGMR